MDQRLFEKTFRDIVNRLNGPAAPGSPPRHSRSAPVAQPVRRTPKRENPNARRK